MAERLNLQASAPAWSYRFLQELTHPQKAVEQKTQDMQIAGARKSLKQDVASCFHLRKGSRVRKAFLYERLPPFTRNPWKRNMKERPVRPSPSVFSFREIFCLYYVSRLLDNRKRDGVCDRATP
jgi:hypothetical protein